MGKKKETPSLIELTKTAYESYSKYVGGFSPVTALMLPDWHNMPRKEQLGWQEAVKTVIESL